jgi:hypothetical protein
MKQPLKITAGPPDVPNEVNIRAPLAGAGISRPVVRLSCTCITSVQPKPSLFVFVHIRHSYARRVPRSQLRRRTSRESTSTTLYCRKVCRGQRERKKGFKSFRSVFGAPRCRRIPNLTCLKILTPKRRTASNITRWTCSRLDPDLSPTRVIVTSRCIPSTSVSLQTIQCILLKLRIIFSPDTPLQLKT